MVRTQTMVQLSEELVAALDREAAIDGTSRSALIREALASFLEQRDTSSAVERYAEGYRQNPPGEPDAWGDLEHDADVAGRELAQRLDDEERAQGLSW